MHAHPENLKLLVAAVFCRAGSESEEANCLAEHLVESNLAGHDSHGVIRVVEYMGWVNDKKICPNQKLAVLVDSETLLVADGQLGYGQVVAAQAVKLGIEKATRGGTAVVALRRCSHLGRMGHWAELAAAAKQVSLHFATTNGLGTLAAPLGGTERRLSANPVAIGIPRTNADPLVLDIATCAIAEGKLKGHKFSDRSYTLYSMRSSFIENHILRGTDAYLLARICGNSVATIMQTYERIYIRKRTKELTDIEFGKKRQRPETIQLFDD